MKPLPMSRSTPPTWEGLTTPLDLDAIESQVKELYVPPLRRLVKSLCDEIRELRQPAVEEEQETPMSEEPEEIISQEDAILALMAIPCKINPKGCDGPWCLARAAIAKAFNVEVVVPKEEEEDDRTDDQRCADEAIKTRVEVHRKLKLPGETRHADPVAHIVGCEECLKHLKSHAATCKDGQKLLAQVLDDSKEKDVPKPT